MKEFISFKNQRDVRSLSFAGCDGAFCSIGCARGLHGLCKSRDYIYETKLARLRVKIIKREHTTRPTRLIYYSLKFLRPNFATIKAIIQTKEKTITRKGRCKTKKLFSTDYLSAVHNFISPLCLELPFESFSAFVLQAEFTLNGALTIRPPEEYFAAQRLKGVEFRQDVSKANLSRFVRKCKCNRETYIRRLPD